MCNICNSTVSICQPCGYTSCSNGYPSVNQNTTSNCRPNCYSCRSNCRYNCCSYGCFSGLNLLSSLFGCCHCGCNGCGAPTANNSNTSNGSSCYGCRYNYSQNTASTAGDAYYAQQYGLYPYNYSRSGCCGR